MCVTVFGEVIDEPLLVVSLVNAETHVSIAFFTFSVNYFVGLVQIHGLHFLAIKSTLQILIFSEEIGSISCEMGHFSITALLLTLEGTKLQKRF